jgi:hypothetical protein
MNSWKWIFTALLFFVILVALVYLGGLINLVDKTWYQILIVISSLLLANWLYAYLKQKTEG